MRETTVENLVVELARALEQACGGGVVAGDLAVAFDADGTLWTGDVGDDFFEAIIAARGIREEAAPALRREAHEAGVERAGDPSLSPADLAHALWSAYHQGKLDEVRFYEIVAWAGAGHTRGELEEMADALHRARDLDGRLHLELRAVFEWIRAQALEVFVVSASPRIVVERGVSRWGIDAQHVLGAEAAFDGDRMLASPRRPIPYGAGKVHGLEGRIGRRPLLAAFGDNVFDIPMLQKSVVPVAVRPKARLLDREAEIPALWRL